VDANGFFLRHVANRKADMRQNEVPGQDLRRIREIDRPLYAAKVHLGRAESGIFAFDAEDSTWNSQTHTEIATP
jgi:hypothetical protein